MNTHKNQATNIFTTEKMKDVIDELREYIYKDSISTGSGLGNKELRFTSNLNIWKLESLINSALEQEREVINKSIELLKMANCPSCDGSGTIQTKVTRIGSRQISETEFEPVPEEDFKIEPCQWCDEKNKLLIENKQKIK